MDPEYLFVERFDDLERRLAEQTLYAAACSAAILRQMFVDTHTLVAQAKKAYGLKLVFSVLHPRHIDFDALGIPRPTAEFLGEQVDGTPQPMLRTSLNHDQFLRYTVTRVGDHAFSVRDVILFVANARGGVHLGPPKDDQVVLADLERTFPLQFVAQSAGERSLISTALTMRGISKIALDGLRPLYEAIVSKRHPKRRVLHVMGFPQEIVVGFPGVRGAVLGNLISTPAKVGPFGVMPPTQLSAWAEKPIARTDLERLALVMGYGTHKPFLGLSVEEIPPDTIGVRLIPETGGDTSAKAVAWRLDDAKPATALVRLEQDGKDVLAIWWEAERPILHFGFRALDVALDCSWAAGLYSLALFEWQPGRISVTYGTTPAGGVYEQRTAIAT